MKKNVDVRFSALHVCQFVRKYVVTVRSRCHISLLNEWISLLHLKSTECRITFIAEKIGRLPMFSLGF